MRPHHGKHSGVRPRYGRITTAASAAGITAVALLGAAGVIPVVAATSSTRSVAVAEPTPAPAQMQLSAYHGPAMMRRPEPRGSVTSTPDALPLSGRGTVESTEVPKRSGKGRRVVFDISAQRVWLVEEKGRVRRTYLVSGSLTDNLRPGNYQVYSTSRHAIGIDNSGRMQFMVRFAQGERAAIGFHDIPVKDGELVQTRSELGTPQSHGCIRQWRPDALALWKFADVGTTVVVTA